MNSDKVASGRRKQEPSNGGCSGASSVEPATLEPLITMQHQPQEDCPNNLVYSKVYTPIICNMTVYKNSCFIIIDGKNY